MFPRSTIFGAIVRLSDRASVLFLALLLASCAAGQRDLLEAPPRVTDPSPTSLNLDALPPPIRPNFVAVYAFPDLTGKNEPNDTLAVFSRAVTQGGSAFLIDALRRAGRGNWFTVVERTNLAALLQERQLITATRKEYEGAKAKTLDPLSFSDLIIEGGIIAFDGNIVTGGIGANYLGIGGDARYRRDTVTVGMRVVSVADGQVKSSVTTTKTIYSVGLTGNTYRYVAVNRLLQIEGGFTRNEPTQLAVRQAIDLAVYATIIEGSRVGLWRFADARVQAALIEKYLQEDKYEPPAGTKLEPVPPETRISSSVPTASASAVTKP